MAIQVKEVGNAGRSTVIATRETFAEAKAFNVSLGVAFMEDDADYKNCADAFLNDGRLLTVTPEGFRNG